MREYDKPLDDPLAALVISDGDHAADDRLRAAVLGQTIGVLRCRRRLKRCALTAGLLACYLAGAATMGFLHTGRDAEHPAAPGPTIADNSGPVSSHRRHGRTDPNQRHVAAKKPSGFESWRRIGDHFLSDSGDVSLAVAGYSEAIHLASAEERRISPERDNWLMMALKQDAQSREKRDVSGKN